MTSPKVYLKQNVLVEPLINQWYAWSGLIPPVTAAMFVANSHLKIMRSFVAAPQTHVAALKNPAMRGGPFISYGAGMVGEIKTLMEKTAREQSHLLELATAIQQLSNTLNEADGSSLEPFYPRIPRPLKGFVELIYDLNGNPSFRFIEGLLYKSEYYRSSSQSVALSLVTEDERPFALSSPILGGNGHLFLPVPFSSPELDELFRMKSEPQSYPYIKERLGVAGEDDPRFSSFFTEEPPPESPKYEGDEVRIRYFGHACILIESKGVSILTDPVISYAYDNDLYRYTYADLPETIDYVLITHNHQDHCLIETLLQLRHKVRHIVVPKNNAGGLVDPCLKLALQNIGFNQVIEIDEMESIEVEGGFIMGLPFLGEHADLNIRTKIAYLVCLNNRTIMCAADSNNIDPELYRHIHKLTGDIDVLNLGMECDGGPLSWLYGPLLTKPLARKQDQSRRLNGSNYERGIEIVNQLNPKQVYVYAMGQEPWLTYLTSIQYTPQSRPIVDSDRLVADCEGRGIIAKRLFGHEEIFL